MMELLIALVFVAFVASPAIIAMLPAARRKERPASQSKSLNVPVRPLSASR